MCLIALLFLKRIVVLRQCCQANVATTRSTYIVNFCKAIALVCHSLSQLTLIFFLAFSLTFCFNLSKILEQYLRVMFWNFGTNSIKRDLPPAVVNEISFYRGNILSFKKFCFRRIMINPISFICGDQSAHEIYFLFSKTIQTALRQFPYGHYSPFNVCKAFLGDFYSILSFHYHMRPHEPIY